MLLEQYDEILTVEKACEILRVGKNALYHMLVNKRLKGHGNGRVRRRPKRPISTNPPVPNGTGGFVMMRYAAGVKLLGLLDGSLCSIASRDDFLPHLPTVVIIPF